MRIAIVHDYLKEIGGAERVLLALKEMYPEAEVYTAYKFPKYWGQFRERMEKWKIYESWGRRLPLLPRFISYYTIISPWFFSRMDLSKYDLVIVSQTGGYFPNGVKIGSKTRLITYCHTPPRFLYGYPTATKARYKWYWRAFSEIANHILRMVDFKFAQRPHQFIANSINVANRIRKFYRREAEVVYPPIETPDKSFDSHSIVIQSSYSNEKKNYYLIVSRIVGSKNIELAVDAANKYGFKLKIAGRAIGEGGRKIAEKIKGESVEYLGEVSDEEKSNLLSGAKAFLALETEPDFGMTTVEPQMYGTPVIAFQAGGYLETVTDGVTGIFFDKLTPEGLNEAIKKFEKVKWNENMIKKNAQRFSKEKFIEGIRKEVGRARTSGN